MKRYYYKKRGFSRSLPRIPKINLFFWRKFSPRGKLYFWTAMAAFFLILIPSAVFVYNQTRKVEAAWFDDSWQYRKSAEVSNSSGGNVANQYVKITVDTSSLISASKMKSDCSDLRVTNFSGKILTHFIDGNPNYDCGENDTSVYVLLDSLPSSGSTILIYYGNQSAINIEPALGTLVKPGLSCRTIKEHRNNGNSNGLYYITLTGNIADTRQVYCDMGTGGGGWTLMFQRRGGGALNNVDSCGSNVNEFLRGSCGSIFSLGYDYSYSIDLDNISNYGEFLLYQLDSNLSIDTDDAFIIQSSNNIFPNSTGMSNDIAVTAVCDINNANCDTTDVYFKYIGNGWYGSAQCNSGLSTGAYLGNYGYCQNGVSTGYTSNALFGNRSGYSETKLWNHDNAADAFMERVFVRESSYSFSNFSTALGSEEKGMAPSAYWKLDEGYGATVRDSTTNNNLGTITGALWQSEDQCLSGRCLWFDGTDDRVNAGNPASDSLDLGTDDFTISAWVRIKIGASARGTIVQKGNDVTMADTTGYWLTSSYGGNSFRFAINDGSGSTFNVQDGTTSYIDGKWHFVTVVGDRDGLMTLYIDGRNVNSTNISALGNVTNDFNFGIGSYQGSGSNVHKGYIDEVKIYHYARTLAQIKLDYSSRGSIEGVSSQIGNDAVQNSSLSNGLIAHWKGDESSGNGADSSGNSNTATIAGANNYGAGKFGNGFRSGVATTNLISYPSFETGIGGWTQTIYPGGSGAGETTGIATQSAIGARSMMIKHPGGAYQVFDWLTSGITVSSGTQYTYSCWVKANTTAANIDIYDGSSWRTVTVPGGSLNQWTRLSTTFTTSTTTLTPRIGVYSPGSQTIAYFDGCQLEQASTATPYLDGSLGTGYSWSGTAHASTSTRTASSATTASSVNTTSGTIAFWFNSPSLDTTSQCPFGALDGDNTGGAFFGLKNTGIYLNHNYGVGVNLTPQYVATINNNRWYHVAYAWDNSARTATLYVNGVPQQTVQIPQAVTKGEYIEKLGTCTRSGYVPFNGTLDDIRAYNKVLSPAEVAAIYGWAPGPRGYYDMEESQGTALLDRSGSGYNGSFTGSPEWGAGKYGKALRFSGSGTYANLGTALNSPTSWTYSAWIRPTSAASGTDSIVGNQNNPALRWNTNATASLFVGWSDAPGYKTISTGTLALNTWHYITGIVDTSDLTNQTLKLYVNGNLVSSTNATTGTLTKPAGANFINRRDSTSLFPGSIDEVRIYNYARSSKQIVEDMNAGHPAGGSPIGSQVGYWKFDEGYGSSVRNSGNGGSRYNGSITGATWSSEGKFGKSVFLSGANTVSIPDGGNALDFGAGDFTISAWIKTSSVANTKNLIRKGAGAGLSGWRFGLQNGRPHILIGDTVTFVENYLGPTSIADNKWHQMMVVFNRAGNAVGYVDGKATGTTINISAINGSVDNGSAIDIGNTYETFTGLLDEVKIYNSALSGEQVKLDYNQGSSLRLGSFGTDSDGKTASSSASRAYCVPGDTSTCNPPIAEWNFEEKQGTTANDSSGNGNSGTLTNSPSWTQGKIGAALSFNGSDTYVSGPNNSSVQLTSGTIQAWIKTSNPGSGFRGIITKQNAFGMFLNSNEFGIWDWGVGAWRGSGQNLNDGKWHSVAVTFNSGVANGTTFYVDGQNKGTTTMTVSSQIIALVAGSGTNGISQIFTGIIDQAKVYNYIRTPAQIAWDYNKGSPLAWWKLDECQGAVAHDSSGFGRDGTITIGGTAPQSSVGTCQTAGTAWGNGASGKFNSSLNFDGEDDVVSFTSTNVINTNAGSVALWAKPSSTQNGTNYYIFDHYGTNSRIYILTNDTGTNLRSCLGACSDNVGSKTVTANTWHHVVVTWNGTTAAFYVDGINNTSTSSFSGLSNVGSTSYIGNYSDAAQGYTGQVDDVRIYNYALTPYQVKNVMNQGAAVRWGPSTGSP